MQKSFLKTIVATVIAGTSIFVMSSAVLADTTYNFNSVSVDSSATDQLAALNSAVQSATNNTFSIGIKDSKSSCSLKTNIEKSYGSDKTYTQAIKLTKSADTGKGLLFTAPDNCTANIIASAESSSKLGTLHCYNVTDSKDNSNSVFTGIDPEEYTLTLIKGKTYCIYSASQSSLVYEVTFVTPKISDTVKEATTITKSFNGINDRFAVRTAGGIYIVHLLTADDITSGNKLTFTGKSGSPIETSEVYSSIQFGEGDVLNASDVSAAALYAIKATNVTEVPTSADDVDYTWTISTVE